MSHNEGEKAVETGTDVRIRGEGIKTAIITEVHIFER